MENYVPVSDYATRQLILSKLQKFKKFRKKKKKNFVKMCYSKSKEHLREQHIQYFDWNATVFSGFSWIFSCFFQDFNNFLLNIHFFFFQPQPYESNIFSTWIEMLQSIEEKASNYASSLQTLETEILKDVKKLKACKQQRMKKFFDRVSFLQKEVEGSVSEVRSQFI